MLANDLYNSLATVWPFASIDDFTGAKVYGLPYLIDCTWKSSSEVMKDSNGKEFVSRYIYYTINSTVNRLDYISKGDLTGNASPFDAEDAEEVQDVKEHDCSFFTIPNDFFLVT